MDSGIDYTIIHPGGLINEPEGMRQFVVDKEDRLLKSRESCTIPRGDLAELVVQALIHPQAKNKVFDVICLPQEDNTGVVSTDFAALFAQLTAIL